jgi:hypothetical protein
MAAEIGTFVICANLHIFDLTCVRSCISLGQRTGLFWNVRIQAVWVQYCFGFAIRYVVVSFAQDFQGGVSFSHLFAGELVWETI